jgi:hypothetical protein
MLPAFIIFFPIVTSFSIASSWRFLIHQQVLINW